MEGFKREEFFAPESSEFCPLPQAADSSSNQVLFLGFVD